MQSLSLLLGEKVRMRAVVKTKNLIDANINVNCYFAPLPRPHPESQGRVLRNSRRETAKTVGFLKFLKMGVLI
jgi:hypothetical protein